MTKVVRVENADTSDYSVVVQIWDGEVLVKEMELAHPTAMTDSSVYITSSRYLVIKEKAK